MKVKYVILAVAAAFPSLQIEAKVVLPPIFSDNMVLQQQVESKIWGTAAEGKPVTLSASWEDKTYNTSADDKGRWSLSVSTPKAGGPYSIKISDGKELVLKNVMIGEVWLCTGQSNMEMKVEGVRNAAVEIANASNYPNIRLMHIKNATSPVPSEEFGVIGGGWRVCSSETIPDFTAAGYFYGRELNEHLDVPIGLIETCWGGTLAEAWTSEQALVQIPYFKPALEKLRNLPVSFEERNKIFVDDINQWGERMLEIDPAFKESGPSWAETTFDDSQWKELIVPGYVQQQGMGDFAGGILWIRKTVDIPSSWEGKTLTLELGAVDDDDFTFFNGVNIGHTEGCLALRKYAVPAELVKAGKATIAVRILDSGGLGGVTGDDMRIVLNDKNFIPLTGEWKSKVSMGIEEVPDLPVNTATEPNYPTFLYNAMINPIIGFAIKGAIWYQGEANVNRAGQYCYLLPLMIDDWRDKWGCAFPFYIVQLANYMQKQTAPEESVWAELRDAQRHSLHLDNTGMAVIIDIGEENDIHPKNKQEVGRRLALVSRAKTYNQDIVYSGPDYESYTIEGGAVRLRFKHADGGILTSDGETPKGFAVAGPDHKFYWAEARIEGEEVVVESKDVSFPVAVRYAWANNPLCNVVNGAGLPAGPFRTDDWSD